MRIRPLCEMFWGVLIAYPYFGRFYNTFTNPIGPRTLHYLIQKQRSIQSTEVGRGRNVHFSRQCALPAGTHFTPVSILYLCSSPEAVLVSIKLCRLSYQTFVPMIFHRYVLNFPVMEPLVLGSTGRGVSISLIANFRSVCTFKQLE